MLLETLGRWAFELQRELVARQKSACNAEKRFSWGNYSIYPSLAVLDFYCKKFARDEVSYLKFCFLEGFVVVVYYDFEDTKS